MNATEMFGEKVVSGGPYRVIYADPAWPTGRAKGQRGGQWLRGMGTWYHHMTAKQILEMPIPDIAADDSYLFLWSSWMHLPLAVAAMSAWGYKYSTGFPWVKCTKDGNPIFGLGVWSLGCSEPFLIGTRGKAPNPRPAREGIEIGHDGYADTRSTSADPAELLFEAMSELVFSSTRQKSETLDSKAAHSKKPDAIRDWITRSIDGPRIELFARERFPGWMAWGDEVGGE